MEFPFSDHVALLEQFLASRHAMVEALERQLFSAKGKALAQNGDRESIDGIFETCFFESPTISHHLSRLKGKLDGAHLADGFERARQDGYARELDPAELVLRASHQWDRARWPGRNARLFFAETLYSVFIFRQLEQLSLRIVDRPSSIGDRPAAGRLRQVQRLLDLLNGSGGAMVRDARWLIQTSQGPLTRHLKPYFIKAAQITESFAGADRVEIHKAGAVLAGGHLRSQLRHLSWRTGWAFDDPQLVALTRSSNSMDLTLLIRDLVPLLDAYAASCAGQDSNQRLVLADAILQGLSADPELLLTRLDLLGPSTTIEDLFIDSHEQESGRLGESGDFRYTEMGQAHVEYLARYGELIGRTATALRQDSLAFDPAHAPYSPLGMVYGFCADLLANMVLNTLHSPSSSDLSLEDMFNSRERLEDKRTRALEWTRLPKRAGERDPFEHSTEWASRMSERLAAALDARASRPTEPNASSVRKACLYVVPRGAVAQGFEVAQGFSHVTSAQEHCLTSDVARARATGATALPADRLIADRAEGRLLACVHSEGAWFGVSKVPLTLCTSQGKDALMTDVPGDVIDVLRQVCPELLIVLSST